MVGNKDNPIAWIGFSLLVSYPSILQFTTMFCISVRNNSLKILYLSRVQPELIMTLQQTGLAGFLVHHGCGRAVRPAGQPG